MKNKKFTASQQKGVANAEKLQIWIRKTPINKIPLNRSGVSAKKPICEILGIHRSTIDSNGKIRELFAQLDKRLTATGDKDCNKVREASQRTGDDTDIPNQCFKRLIEENEALRTSLNRLRYLEDTGRLVDEG